MLSDVQKRKLTHLFEVLDSNRNGRLEWGDFERVAMAVVGTRDYRPGTEEHERLMRHYRRGWEQAKPFAVKGGLTLDGWLQYHDVILRTPGMYDSLVRPAANMIFDTFDLDDDEKVTVEEWREFFRCHAIPPRHADECFGYYDLDGDGYVSRAEMLDLVGQFYMSSDPEAPGNFVFGAYSRATPSTGAASMQASAGGTHPPA